MKYITKSCVSFFHCLHFYETFEKYQIKEQAEIERNESCIGRKYQQREYCKPYNNFTYRVSTVNISYAENYQHIQTRN